MIDLISQVTYGKGGILESSWTWALLYLLLFEYDRVAASTCAMGFAITVYTSPNSCRACGLGTYSITGSFYPQRLISFMNDNLTYECGGLDSNSFPLYAVVRNPKFTFTYLTPKNYGWCGALGCSPNGPTIITNSFSDLPRLLNYVKSYEICAGCTPGKYATGIGNPGCDLCPSGTYNPDYGNWNGCTPCPAYSYAYAGATACTLCVSPAGYGLFSCGQSSAGILSQCTGGFYASGGVGAQATPCLPCPTGTYTTSSQASLCTNCQ